LSGYNPKDLIKKIFRNEKIENFPEIIPIATPTIDVMKIKNIYWPAAHRDPYLMAELSATSIELFGFNAANVPFDMAIEAEALGSEIIWKEGNSSTPQVKAGRFNGNILNFNDDILNCGRIPVVLDAIKLLKKRYRNIPIIPFIQGPFTVGCNVAGPNNIFMDIIKNPVKTKNILDRLTDLFILYSKEQIDSGADYIMILDPSVMGLTSKQFNNFILPVYRRIRNETDADYILHICGNVNKILDLIPESGFPAFSFDSSGVDVETVIKKIGSRMKVIGSVPTVSHLLNSSEKEIIDISIKFIKSGVDILAPSCCIPPDASLDNVKAIMKSIHYWNKIKKGKGNI